MRALDGEQAYDRRIWNERNRHFAAVADRDRERRKYVGKRALPVTPVGDLSRKPMPALPRGTVFAAKNELYLGGRERKTVQGIAVRSDKVQLR
jgi:hypothetical protein